MSKIVIILSLLIIAYLVLYKRFLLKKNNDLTIYQLNYSNLDDIVKYYRIKSPTIIYPWIQYLPTLSKINLQYLYQHYPNIKFTNKKTTVKSFIDNSLNKKKRKYIEDSHFLENTKLDSIFKKELNLLYPQFLDTTTAQTEIYPRNHTTPLLQTNNYRTVFIQLEGIQKIVIFNPKQIPYLYLQNKKSQVDFWNQNNKLFSKFSKSKYLEIIMRPGTVFYLPNYWCYTKKSMTDSLSVTLSMDTYLSLLLNKF